MLHRLFELLRPLLGIALLGAFLATPLIAFFARFGDGPLGPFPGGPLQGDVFETPESWSFVAEEDSIEIQLGTDPPHSVRTGLVVHQGAAYAPVWLEPFSRWGEAALEHPQLLVRIDRRLYPVRAMPVYDPDWHDELMGRARRKYGSLLYGDHAWEWTGFIRLGQP